jgi:hypothetical protein
VGQLAFGGIAPNQKDGILITSTNPGFQKDDESTHNTIRTSLVGGNKGNGIEIAGAANGVQIIDAAVGTNASISKPIPNKGSGIVIGGTSHNIAIGGFRPSVEGFYGNFGVHVGGNGGYGIEIRDLAYDIVVYNPTVGVGTGPTVGSGLSLAAKLPNLRGGIFVGAGVTEVTIGGKLNERDAYSNAIAFNGGDGIRIAGASGISVLGSVIQSNAGGGVTLQGGENNQIGASGRANAIVTDGKWGVYASGSLAGSAVQGNEIRGNRGNGVVLRAAQGLLVGGTASGSGNAIFMNKAFGLLATGNCSGSTVEGNTIVRNGAGNVNVVRLTKEGFVGPTAGARRFAQYGPTQVTSPDQLNQPIGQEKADEIARALGLDRSKCFTEEQYLAFISGNGANGSGDPQQAALVDESVNLLTNSTVNPLNRDINGTPTQIYLGSYGLAVSKDGVWLDSLANEAEPTRRVNEVIAPRGYMDTWAKANGATASLDMLRKSAYTIQLPYGIVAQQVNGSAQLAVYRDGFSSAVVGLSMTPPLWEVNFCLIYMLNPRLAANMPAQWNQIPAEVVTAFLMRSELGLELGRVRFSDYASYFPAECVVAEPG